MAIDLNSPYFGSVDLLRNTAVEEVDVRQAGPNGQDFALSAVAAVVDPAFVATP